MTNGRTASAITDGDKFASFRLWSSDCRHWTEGIEELCSNLGIEGSGADSHRRFLRVTRGIGTGDLTRVPSQAL